MSDIETMNWISFPREQLQNLLQILGDTDGTEARAIRRTIAHFTTSEVKDGSFRARANDLSIVDEGSCEIDDWAVVSRGEHGAYVMAWVWVDNEMAEAE